VVRQFGFPLSQLPPQFRRDGIDPGVEIGPVFFRVEVRTGDGKPGADHEAPLGIRGAVLADHDMRGKHATVDRSEAAEFFHNVLFDRLGEAQMPRCHM
jgi:hypothetical protein